MAEVENGSPNEPAQQSIPLSENDVKTTPDDSSPPDAPPHLEADKPGLPIGPESLQVDSEEPNAFHDDSEPGGDTSSTEQPPNPSNDVIETPDPGDYAGSQPESRERSDGSPDAQSPTAGEEEPPSEKEEVGSVPPQDELPDSRMRSDSRSTTTTQATHRSSPVSSAVFIVTALDAIGASREARRSKELEDAVKNALANIKQSEQRPINPEILFRPLYLATRSLSVSLQVTALDCIGKLITYSYFAFPSTLEGAPTEPSAAPDQPPLIERAIDAICDCFENEATSIEIQQQIIKSLLAAVLNDKIVVHGAGLLKAVRQIYNIFIYSKSSQNQQIAQGSLTQMVSTVFDRVRVRMQLKDLRMREGEQAHESSPDTVTLDAVEVSQSAEQDQVSDSMSTAPDQPVTKEPTEKLTLQSFESNNEDPPVTDNAPTTVTRAKVEKSASRSVSSVPEDSDVSADDEEDEIYIKDAFLVFRALCKLSHKLLSHDQQQDLKSQNMRSKLLTLHLIHYLVNEHIAVFTSPVVTIKSSSSNAEAVTLLQALRPHLCLSLSRNGSSSVPRVFEVCCEIFWLMLKHMRVMMKVCYPNATLKSYLTRNRKSSRYSSRRSIWPFSRSGTPRLSRSSISWKSWKGFLVTRERWWRFISTTIVIEQRWKISSKMLSNSCRAIQVCQSLLLQRSSNSIRRPIARFPALEPNGISVALCLHRSRL